METSSRPCRSHPELIDLVRAQDVGLRQAKDPVVLAWAAEQQRIVVTHDIKTMPGFAYERVRGGLPMPGLIAVPKSIGIGRAIADLMYIGACGRPEDFTDRIYFLPL
jgi:hypothetical protein